MNYSELVTRLAAAGHSSWEEYTTSLVASFSGDQREFDVKVANLIIRALLDDSIEAANAISALTARVAELEEVLDECETYFDNRADAEYFTDSPFPVGNEEMGLLVTVRKARKGGDA